MTDCCSTSDNTVSAPRKRACPVNGKKYALVSAATIRHHMKNPWSWEEVDQGYYFCDDPECSVVYFGQDNFVLETTDLRTSVGIKDSTKKAIVCYCYGVSIADAKNNLKIRDFVLEETKRQRCACEVFNPSGRCCLKNFPNAEE